MSSKSLPSPDARFHEHLAVLTADLESLAQSTTYVRTPSSPGEGPKDPPLQATCKRISATTTALTDTLGELLRGSARGRWCTTCDRLARDDGTCPSCEAAAEESPREEGLMARLKPLLQGTLPEALIALVERRFTYTDGVASYTLSENSETHDNERLMLSARPGLGALLSLAGRQAQLAPDEDVAELLVAHTSTFDYSEGVDHRTGKSKGRTEGTKKALRTRHMPWLQLLALEALGNLARAGALTRELERGREWGAGRLFTLDAAERPCLRTEYVERLCFWVDGMSIDPGKRPEESAQPESYESCTGKDRVLALQVLAEARTEAPSRLIAASMARAFVGLTPPLSTSEEYDSARPGKSALKKARFRHESEPPGTRSLALERLLDRIAQGRDDATVAARGGEVTVADKVRSMAAAVPPHPGEQRPLGKAADATALRAYFNDFLDDPDILNFQLTGHEQPQYEQDKDSLRDPFRRFWFAFEARIEPGSVLPVGEKPLEKWYRFLPDDPLPDRARPFVYPGLVNGNALLDRAPNWHARRQLHVAMVRGEADLAERPLLGAGARPRLERDYQRLACASPWWGEKKAVTPPELLAATFRDAFFTYLQPLVAHAAPSLRRTAARLAACAREPRMLPHLLRAAVDPDDTVRAIANEVLTALVPEAPDGTPTLDWCELPRDPEEKEGPRWVGPIGPRLRGASSRKGKSKSRSEDKGAAEPDAAELHALEALRCALVDFVSEPFVEAGTPRFAAQTTALRLLRRMGGALRSGEDRLLLFALRQLDPDLHDWAARSLGSTEADAFAEVRRPAPVDRSVPDACPPDAKQGGRFPDSAKTPCLGTPSSEAAVPTADRPFAGRWLDGTFRAEVQQVLRLRLGAYGRGRAALRPRFPAPSHESDPAKAFYALVHDPLERTAWLDLVLFAALAGAARTPLLRDLARDEQSPPGLRAMTIRYLAEDLGPAEFWVLARDLLRSEAHAHGESPTPLAAELLHFLALEGNEKDPLATPWALRKTLYEMNALCSDSTSAEPEAAVVRAWLSDRFKVREKFQALASLDTPFESVRAHAVGRDARAEIRVKHRDEEKSSVVGLAHALRLLEPSELETLLGAGAKDGLQQAPRAWLLDQVVPPASEAAPLNSSDVAGLLLTWLQGASRASDDAPLPRLTAACARLLAHLRARPASDGWASVLAALAPQPTEQQRSPCGQKARLDVARLLASWIEEPGRLTDAEVEGDRILSDLPDSSWVYAAADVLDRLHERPDLLCHEHATSQAQGGEHVLEHVRDALGLALARAAGWGDAGRGRVSAFLERLEGAWDRAARAVQGSKHDPAKFDEVDLDLYWLRSWWHLEDSTYPAISAHAARLVRQTELAAGPLAVIAQRSGVAELRHAAARLRAIQLKVLREEYDLLFLDSRASYFRSDHFSAHFMVKTGLERGKIKLSTSDHGRFWATLQAKLEAVRDFRSQGGDFFERFTGLLARDGQLALLDLPCERTDPEKEAATDDLLFLLTEGIAFDEACTELENLVQGFGVQLGSARPRPAWRLLLADFARDAEQHPLLCPLAGGKGEDDDPAEGSSTFRELLAHVGDLERLRAALEHAKEAVWWRYSKLLDARVLLARFRVCVRTPELRWKFSPKLPTELEHLDKSVAELRRTKGKGGHHAGVALDGLGVGLEVLQAIKDFHDDEKSATEAGLQGVKSGAAFLKFAIERVSKGPKATVAAKGLGTLTSLISVHQSMTKIHETIDRATAPETPAWEVPSYEGLWQQVGPEGVRCLGHMCKCFELVPGPGKVVALIGDCCIATADAYDIFDSLLGSNEFERAAAYLGYEWLYWFEPASG